jgi:prepilin-type N-terminal cleavage/methylation domain-containing protein
MRLRRVAGRLARDLKFPTRATDVNSEHPACPASCREPHLSGPSIPETTRQVTMQQPPRDSGFTLIELLVTISLMCVIMAFAVGAWSAWAKSSAHSGTARELQSAMRQAQQRAVTEGRATCVQFDDAQDRYKVFTGACTSPPAGGWIKAAANVRIDTPSFTSTTGVPGPNVSFQGRGTGTPGDVLITRTGSSKTYTITVDWLTGRVSLS